MFRKRGKAYGRTWWRGVLLNNRTISALKRVEQKSGITIQLSQGSYNVYNPSNPNGGGVRVSGGTHDGGGACDLKISGLTASEQHHLDHWMRREGFASWIRQPIPGLWGLHLHAELIGDKQASGSAVAQWAAFRSHRNGLANCAWDSAWRPRIPRRWNHRLNRIVLHPLPGQNLTPAQRRLLPKGRP